MNPNFGGITRPHSHRTIKREIQRALVQDNIDTTGKLAEIVKAAQKTEENTSA